MQTRALGKARVSPVKHIYRTCAYRDAQRRRGGCAEASPLTGSTHISTHFFPGDAMQARPIVMRCLSCVRHVRECYENEQTYHQNLHHRVKQYTDGNPLITGASNAGEVGRNRDFEPISAIWLYCLLLTLQQARCCQHGRRCTSTATYRKLSVTYRRQ